MSRDVEGKRIPGAPANPAFLAIAVALFAVLIGVICLSGFNKVRELRHGGPARPAVSCTTVNGGRNPVCGK